jgi:hypothetical protein
MHDRCRKDLGGAYESLVAVSPLRIDFPKPPGSAPARYTGSGKSNAKYADWLIAIFNCGMASGQPIQTRTFDSVISTCATGQLAAVLEPGSEGLAVIDTGASYEQADSLKVPYDGVRDSAPAGPG